MGVTGQGWNVLDQDAAILWREYRFAPDAVATTLVFRGAGDGLVVVSPSTRTDPAALDALSEHGEVVALIASNGFHHLGQLEWRKRFPKARSFAPSTGIARIAKRLPDLAPFEPLEAAAPLLGEHASVVDAPGFKMGNAFVTVRTPRGSYWYPSDLLANIEQLPSQLVFKLVMSMTRSAPGYRLFRPAVWLQVKDKREVHAWADAELTRSAPTTVVPAHGPPVSGADVVARTRALLSALG